MTDKQKECTTVSSIYAGLDKRRSLLFKALVDLAMVLESMPPQSDTGNPKETKSA